MNYPFSIAPKAQPDPVADLPMVEAYMRWALIAAEEEIGREVLAEVLRANGLTKWIDQYPTAQMQLSSTITLGDYAALNTGLLAALGDNGIDRLIKIGSQSTKPALEQQGKLLNFASRAALKLLPQSSQVKAVLDGIKSDLDKLYKAEGYEVEISVEDRGTTWAYIDPSCALCAGKVAEAPICWGWVGTLSESLAWLTGKEFEVNQVDCRAMGASACVWEVSKTAKK